MCLCLNFIMNTMNTKYYFFAFILAAFLITNGSAQSLQANQDGISVQQSLFTPDAFKHLNDSTLLIMDLSSTNYPVYTVDIKKDTIVNKIMEGSGPGELSVMDKSISVVADTVYIWDYGHQMLNIYDHNLRYIEAKRLPDYTNTLLTNGEHIFIIDNTDEFIKVYQYSDESFPGKLIQQFTKDDHPEFSQFKNFGIWQGFKISLNRNGNLALGNRFTSLIFAVNKDGLVFKTSKPDKIVQDTHPGDWDATDVAYNAMCALSIGIDNSGQVYSLYKGEKADLNTITTTYENRINDYLQDFEASDKLLVYSNGAYSHTLTLPVVARAIEVWRDQLFVMHNDNGEPEIRAYQLE